MLPTRTRQVLWSLWSVAAVVGTVGLVERVLQGHQPSATGSYVVWGLWVSAYIYFIGLSAGSFLLSSLVYVFRVRQLERVARLSLFVAVVTLGMAVLAIWFDLGRMGRFYRIFTSPNFRSMMTWMVWLYTTYMLVMVAELWIALRPSLIRWATLPDFRGAIGRTLAFANGPLTGDHRRDGRAWLEILAAVGIPLAIFFHGGVGALFSTLAARPFWHTPLMPVLFLTGALVSGGALMAFNVAAFWPVRDEAYRATVVYLGRAVLGLLLFDVVLEWAEFSVPMWYGVGHEYELLMRMLFGEFWWVFWLVHVGLGTLIPLALLLARGTEPRAVGLAGLLVTLTFMTVRLNIVIPGLIEPSLRGLMTAFSDHRLTFVYVPNFFEWRIIFLVVALGSALFYLGFRFLPLTEDDGEEKTDMAVA